MARHDEFVGRLSSSKSTTLGTSAPIARSIRLLCAPIGTIYQLDDPFRGRRHDAGVLKDTKLYEKFVKVAKGNKYVIYGDPAYPLKPLLLKPYGGARLQP
ncbi:hypothetical protein MRX96_056802 [Rhipicephalus microplus]